MRAGDLFDDLRVYCANCRSFKYETELYRGLVFVEKKDIKVITESGMDLNGTKFSSRFEVRRYISFNVDRQGKCRRGVS